MIPRGTGYLLYPVGALGPNVSESLQRAAGPRYQRVIGLRGVGADLREGHGTHHHAGPSAVDQRPLDVRHKAVLYDRRNPHTHYHHRAVGRYRGSLSEV